MKNSLATKPQPEALTIALTPEYVAQTSENHNQAVAALEAARKVQAHASVALDAATGRGASKAEQEELRHRFQDAEADAIKAGKRLEEAKAKLDVVREMVAAQERKEAAGANKARLAELARLTAVRQEAADALGAAADALLPAWQRFVETTSALVPHIASTNKRPAGQGAGCAIAGSDVEMAVRMHLCKLGFRWAIAWPWELEKIPTLPQRIRTANAYLLSSEGATATSEKSTG